MRSAGMPITIDTTAPTSPPASSATKKFQPACTIVPAMARAEAGERPLAEADLAGPAGEDHERDARGWRVSTPNAMQVDAAGPERERDDEQQRRATSALSRREPDRDLGRSRSSGGIGRTSLIDAPRRLRPARRRGRSIAALWSSRATMITNEEHRVDDQRPAGVARAPPARPCRCRRRRRT